MRLKTFLIASGCLVAAGVSALAWQQYEELVALRARLGTDGDRGALEARLAALQRENRELSALVAAKGEDGSAADLSTDGAKSDNPEDKAAAMLATLAGADADGGISKKDAELELLGALADLPEFQRLIALQQRGAIDAKYAALIRKLHLSPEQAAQFERLLADRQSAYADALIAAHDQGLTGKEAKTLAQSVAKATQKDVDASLKSLLGPQGYNQYQNYEHTLPQRDTVTQLAQRLSYTATPLTPRQQDQLVQTLAQSAHQEAAAVAANAAATGQKAVRPAATVTPLPNALGNLGISSSSSAVITTTAVARAQTFLSPAQMSALQQMQQEQQAQQTLGKLLRTGGAGKPKSGKH